MSLQDLMRTLEGHQFAAEVNLASGSEAFYRGLVNHGTFRELSDHAKEMNARRLIFARLIELSKNPVQVEYENPGDVALTAYLLALEPVEQPDRLVLAAHAVAQAPNCWWAATVANEILAHASERQAS